MYDCMGVADGVQAEATCNAHTPPGVTRAAHCSALAASPHGRLRPPRPAGLPHRRALPVLWAQSGKRQECTRPCMPARRQETAPLSEAEHSI